jgi:hypothetical protein
MTVVGKILVFIVLAFSLVVGGMAVMVYITRTHYGSELTKEKNYRKLDQANLAAYKQEVADLRAEKDKAVTELRDTLKKVQDDLVQQQDKNRGLNEKLDAEAKKSIQAEATLKAAEVEVKRRQDDVEKTRETLNVERTKVEVLTVQNVKYKDEATLARIELRTVRDINIRLENQLQELARDNARIKAGAGAGTTVVAKPGDRNPPPDQVEGLIKTADPGGLVKITLGSDAGLQRGHTLEVFRLNPNPTLSKYLGRIRIIEVTATEAVGQPTARMPIQPQAGDHVASRVLGGG